MSRTSQKIWIITLSRTEISLLKRLTILPVGVLSKNNIGDRKTLKTSFSYKLELQSKKNLYIKTYFDRTAKKYPKVKYPNL
jgi:hypothetical protein